MPTLQDSTASMACMEHQVFEHIKQALLVTLNWHAPSVSMPRKLSSLQFTIKSFHAISIAWSRSKKKVAT